MTDTLLQVEALEAGYGDVQVLWGISLKVARGSMTTARWCLPTRT